MLLNINMNITLLFPNTDTMSGVDQTHSWKVRTLKLCLSSLGWQTYYCFLVMTFQFTHKIHTTSPKSFQAREHALLPVSESEGKTSSTLIYHSCHWILWLRILPFLQKGLEPPADTGTGILSTLRRRAGLSGSWQPRAAAQASTYSPSPNCKPQWITVNSPKAHSWRAGSSSFFSERMGRTSSFSYHFIG